MSASLIPPGIRYMLISTFSFGIMNVCIKLLSHIPTMELLFFRCAISMIICLTLLHSDRVDWRGSHRGLLIARGVAGTLAVYTFFLTIRMMPLATAVTIQYTSPIFSTLIAAWIIGEQVKPLQYLFFLFSFAGVILIKGFDSQVSITYIMIGLASAVTSGIAYNLVRSLRDREHPIVVVLHFQIVGVIAGLIACIWQWQTPQGIDWVYILIIGICTQVGQVYLTRALQSERISVTSSLNYFGVLYALIFGMIFFHESYIATTLMGIVLVIGGVLLNIFYAATPAAVAPIGMTDAEE